nr:insulinase family protein [Candidatus Omnitrophota bacterium]
EMDTTLGYLALGFHSTALTDEDLYAMDILSMALGRGDNSRLNKTLYKNKGLVHTVSAWNYTPKYPGLFVVTAILPPDNAEKTAVSVLEEIEAVKDGGLTEEELETARRTVLSDYIFRRETTEGLADDIASNFMLTGSPNFSERYIEGINGVSQDDIRRVAKRYLVNTNLTEIRLMPRGTSPQKTAILQPDKSKGRIEKSTLPNGLKVLIHKNSSSPSVAITVAGLGGIMVEDEKTNGISSLVSRMIFKGTKNRKESELVGAIERMGGSADTFSASSSFGFTIKCLKEDLDVVLDISMDVLTNATFPEEELEKEKRLTLAMIKEEDDAILERGMNSLRGEMYPGSPYGMRYLGEESSIKNMARPVLQDFYKRYYTANNLVLSVSGDVEIAELQQKLSHVFSGIARSEETASIPGSVTAPSGPVSKNISMQRDESLYMSGFHSASMIDSDRYSMEVVSSVLSGQSGRMFDELRDKRSLAYSLGCIQRSSINTGLFIFYVATSKEKINDVKKSVAEQISSIRRSTVPEKELEMARKELVTRYLVSAQSNEYISTNAAIEELCGNGADRVFDYEDSINRVTAEDIKRSALKYLDPDKSAEVTISPR